MILPNHYWLLFALITIFHPFTVTSTFRSEEDSPQQHLLINQNLKDPNATVQGLDLFSHSQIEKMISEGQGQTHLRVRRRVKVKSAVRGTHSRRTSKIGRHRIHVGSRNVQFPKGSGPRLSNSPRPIVFHKTPKSPRSLPKPEIPIGKTLRKLLTSLLQKVQLITSKARFKLTATTARVQLNAKLIQKSFSPGLATLTDIIEILFTMMKETETWWNSLRVVKFIDRHMPWDSEIWSDVRQMMEAYSLVMNQRCYDDRDDGFMTEIADMLRGHVIRYKGIPWYAITDSFTDINERKQELLKTKNRRMGVEDAPEEDDDDDTDWTLQPDELGFTVTPGDFEFPYFHARAGDDFITDPKEVEEADYVTLMKAVIFLIVQAPTMEDESKIDMFEVISEKLGLEDKDFSLVNKEHLRRRRLLMDLTLYTMEKFQPKQWLEWRQKWIIPGGFELDGIAYQPLVRKTTRPLTSSDSNILNTLEGEIKTDVLRSNPLGASMATVGLGFKSPSVSIADSMRKFSSSLAKVEDPPEPEPEPDLTEKELEVYFPFIHAMFSLQYGKKDPEQERRWNEFTISQVLNKIITGGLQSNSEKLRLLMKWDTDKAHPILPSEDQGLMV